MVNISVFGEIVNYLISSLTSSELTQKVQEQFVTRYCYIIKSDAYVVLVDLTNAGKQWWKWC